MPFPSLDKVLFSPDEKVFVINPQKNQPPLRNPAKAIDLADAVMLWATREAHLPKYQARMEEVPPESLLWVCYPKLGRLETDLGRDKLLIWMKRHGFEGVRLVSMDDTWAAASFRREAAALGQAASR
ncbi:MAG TPA: hypothetical protein VI356_19540 [Myxococcales bacterium]